MKHADAPLPVDSDRGRNQHFHRARRCDVHDVLKTLAAPGHVEETDNGAFAT